MTETLPDGTEARRVERLDFRLSEPQVHHDSFRRTDRVMRYKGACVVCARRTYSFDDGENDPRGPLGDHSAATLIAEEHEQVGPDVPLCFTCGNTHERYLRGVKKAEALWRDPPALIDLSWLREHKVEAETFWEPARLVDGYDRMDLASKHGWLALSLWGADGWNFLEWPYYVGYIRNVDTDEGKRFELATNCEGDVDVWRFDTQEQRQEALDDMAFWHWQSKGYSWVKGVFPDERPDHLRGPMRTT